MGGASPAGGGTRALFRFSTKAGRCSFLALAVESGTGSFRVLAFVATAPGCSWMPSAARTSGLGRWLSLVANPLVASSGSPGRSGSAPIGAATGTWLTLTDGFGTASATGGSASGAFVVARRSGAGVVLNVDVHHHPPAMAPASSTIAAANR